MAKKLSKKSFEKIKKYYLAEKARLEKILSTELGEIDSDGDEIDIIQAKSLLETSNKISSINLNTWNKIRSVLNRIDIDNINSCKECEESIGEKRLLANPGCTICFDCASDAENTKKMYR